jgi:hypothetical protein
VPAEHHRAGRGQQVDHRGKVVAELVDGDLCLAPGRPAVPALVVADEPEIARRDPGGELVGDVVPGGLGQRPAVGEDDGDRSVVGAVDRGVQLGAVRGADGGDAAPDGRGHAATSALVAGVPT